MLVHSKHSDGVAIGVHAGSGWVGRHLASPVHPARIMDWQHNPLAAVDGVARIHARWSRISFFLFYKKKRVNTLNLTNE